MNKDKYLSRLKKALEQCAVDDIDEILEQYQEHFEGKLFDGYTEEEIAARLEAPEVIARQFALSDGFQKRRSITTCIGMVLLDVGMLLLNAMLYPFAMVVGVSALSLLMGGGCLLLGTGIDIIAIPPMPDAGRIFLAIALTGLAVLTAAAAVYYTLLINQLNRAYFYWRRKTATGRKGPNHSIFPRLPGKLKRCLRTITLTSLLLFVSCFVCAYIIMLLKAGAFEFWHTWHWFS